MRALFAAALATGLAACTLAAPVAPSAQAGVLELFIRPHATNFPECHDHRVLATIVDRFNDAERRTWHRHLFMEEVRGGHERFKRTGPRHGAHPVRRDHGGLQHGRQIPRRYCTATALLTNHDPRPTIKERLEDKLAKVKEKIGSLERDAIAVHGYGGRHVGKGDAPAHPRHFRRRVLYLIEAGQGFAGTHHKVFFCIDGLDPWRVYDGHCRVLTRAN